jgi:hypothetical protein
MERSTRAPSFKFLATLPLCAQVVRVETRKRSSSAVCHYEKVARHVTIMHSFTYIFEGSTVTYEYKKIYSLYVLGDSSARKRVT